MIKDCVSNDSDLLKNFKFPDRPIWDALFDDQLTDDEEDEESECALYAKNGNGGLDARQWDKFAVLTVNEAIALSCGLNPLRADEFFSPENMIKMYGTLQLGIIHSQEENIVRAIIAGHIKTIKKGAEINGNTQIVADDVKVFLLSQEENTRELPQKTAHTSELLEIMQHCIAEVWENHDPKNPPSNALIFQWLDDNYKDSTLLTSNTKSAICTVMRPQKYK